jgi:uncharacterized membrane protein YfcA
LIFDTPVMHQPAFWLLGVAGVFIIGLGKGGFVGLGTLGTPLLALAIPPVQAAAVILPLLLVQDAVSVWAFRKSWDRHVLAVMLPSATVGIGIGYLFAASLPERWVLGALGLISILFGAQRLWAERGGKIVPSHILPDWVGALCGVGAGLSSQIAHAGAPPYQLWVMPRRLPQNILVGTTAIQFAAMNWIKVPAYAGLGEFTPQNLLASALLLPVAILSTFAGVWLVRRVQADRFYALAYGLLVLVGVKLLWDAVS